MKKVAPPPAAKGGESSDKDPLEDVDVSETKRKLAIDDSGYTYKDDKDDKDDSATRHPVQFQMRSKVSGSDERVIAEYVPLYVTPLRIKRGDQDMSKGKGLTIRLIDLLKALYPATFTDKDILEVVTSKGAFKVKHQTATTMRLVAKGASWLAVCPSNEMYTETLKAKCLSAGWFLKRKETGFITMPEVLELFESGELEEDDFLPSNETATETRLCAYPNAWWYRLNSVRDENKIEDPDNETWHRDNNEDQRMVFQLGTTMKFIRTRQEKKTKTGEKTKRQVQIALELPKRADSDPNNYKPTNQFKALYAWAFKRIGPADATSESKWKRLNKLHVELLWSYTWGSNIEDDKPAPTKKVVFKGGVGYSAGSDGVVEGMHSFIAKSCKDNKSIWTVYFKGQPMYAISYVNDTLGCGLHWHKDRPTWASRAGPFSYYFGPKSTSTITGQYPLIRSTASGEWIDGRDGISGIQFANSDLSEEECKLGDNALTRLTEKKRKIVFTINRTVQFSKKRQMQSRTKKKTKTVAFAPLCIAYDWLGVNARKAVPVEPTEPSVIGNIEYTHCAGNHPKATEFKIAANWQIRQVGYTADERAKMGKIRPPDPRRGPFYFKRGKLGRLQMTKRPARPPIIIAYPNVPRFSRQLSRTLTKVKNNRFASRPAGVADPKDATISPKPPWPLVDTTASTPAFIMRKTSGHRYKCLIHCVLLHFAKQAWDYCPRTYANRGYEFVMTQLRKKLEKISEGKQSKVTPLLQTVSLGYAGMIQSLVKEDIEALANDLPLGVAAIACLSEMFQVNIRTWQLCLTNRLLDDTIPAVALIGDNTEDVRVKIRQSTQINTKDTWGSCNVLHCNYGDPFAAGGENHFNLLENFGREDTDVIWPEVGGDTIQMERLRSGGKKIITFDTSVDLSYPRNDLFRLQDINYVHECYLGTCKEWVQFSKLTVKRD